MSKTSSASVAVLATAVILALPGAAAGFGPAAELLSGLAKPGELAIDSKGDLWFTQNDADSTTLYVRPKGTTLAVPMRDVPGDMSRGATFVGDIAFDASDAPHFVEWVDGSTLTTKLVRFDPGSGTATTLASASGTTSDGFTLTSGASIDQLEVAAGGTVYYVETELQPTGERAARIKALAPGATSPSVVAEFATPGRHESIPDLDAFGDGSLYLSETSIPVSGGPTPTLSTVYRITPGQVPQVVRSGTVVANHLGLDAAGNLYLRERVTSGQVRPGCAESSTFRVTRYDAAALAGPAPAGTVISSATYAGFVWMYVGSSTVFRVSDDGDVLFGLYPGNTRCGSPPGPVTFTRLMLVGVEAGDPSGAQNVLLDDVPPEPASEGPHGIAVLKNDAYATSFRLGTLHGFTLKEAKKPKKEK